VQEIADGILVKIGYRDLDVKTLSVLADELYGLALESDRPTLYLDFSEVQYVPSVVAGKLFALGRKLQEIGGHLILCNLNPVVRELLADEGWPAGAITEVECSEGERNW
jgi:anti-anti-sigma regulatory factor